MHPDVAVWAKTKSWGHWCTLDTSSSSENYWYFSFFSLKTYVVSTHNMFWWKNIMWIPLLIWSMTVFMEVKNFTIQEMVDLSQNLKDKIFFFLLAHLSSAQDELLWSLSVRRPSVRPSVRGCVHSLTFSNDFSSEAAEPILLKFHMEPP